MSFEPIPWAIGMTSEEDESGGRDSSPDAARRARARSRRRGGDPLLPLYLGTGSGAGVDVGTPDPGGCS